jgi:hypothetical protein
MSVPENAGMIRSGNQRIIENESQLFLCTVKKYCKITHDDAEFPNIANPAQ